MMNKEALHFMREQTIQPADRVVEFTDLDNNDRIFLIDDKGIGHEVNPIDTRANYELELNTLKGIVDYLRSGERSNKDLIIHVVNEEKVILTTHLDSRGNRETLVISHAIVPKINFDLFLSVEKLIIALQAQFVKTPDRDLILQVIGNIKEDNVRNANDDGVSQAVTIKQGIASATDVKVPNPVTLAPYRTFIEVAQPKSDFIFRMKEGPQAAIFEADGGAWRNEAIANICKYFEKELKEEIENGILTIIS